MFPSNAGNMSMGGLNNNGNVNGGNMGAGLGFGMNNNGSQMHGNMANGVQSQETGNSQSTSEYTLAGILHHLQSEWRRYEKDRNEWEIERAELRARIALLEGERRGVENLKTDLMRRVKMLEYALRQERSKYLSSGGSTINSQSASSPLSANAPPAKNPLLQGLEKGTSSSGRSSPAPFPEAAPTASAIAAAAGSAGAMGTGLLSRSTSSAKDPKSRAKSREYLKQCLQEISYLTSASTLNPLPDRGIASGSAANGTNMQSALRPRKTMLENVPPTLPAPTESHAALAGSISRASGAALGIPNAKGGRPGRSPLFASEPVLEETNEAEEPQEGGLETVPEQREVDGAEQLSSGASESVAPLKNPLSATFAEPETSSSASPDETGEEQREQDEAPGSSGSSDSSRSSQSTDSRGNSAGSMTDQEMDEQEQVTAIFKPGGRDWQKLKEAGIKSRERRESERQGQAAEEASIISEAQQQLAITSEKVNQLMNRSGRAAGSERKDEEELANLSLVAEDDEAAKEAAEAAADSLLWKSKKVLRSHLDAVRAVAFLPNEMCLLSTSDDNTIKFWNLDAQTLNQPAGKSGTDSQPLVTFRGHSAAVTCVAVSRSKRRFYSGSLDSSIRVWQLPDGSTEAYPPFEKSMELGCLVGHSQAVWDVALVPDRSDDEGRLASASADGLVKVWNVGASQAEGKSKAAATLELSWDYFGTEPAAEAAKEREDVEKSGTLPVPTCVEACHWDLRLVAVSYSNSVVKLFELDTGRQVRQLKSDETFDGTAETQINKLVTHPTLPLLITAHEDGYIRMFDLDTGACTLSMVAHLDAVTSLDIDASGLTLVSGGHDCSVRFWEIAGGTLSGKEGSGVAGEAGQSGSASSAVCRQEISSHRKKAGEGVLAVKYHPTAPYFASAGADGVIRIYG
ncbi:cell-cycle nuclear protein [Moesziomyces antarcticus T-34]|uniref:Cell-cycle nuclear protein n=1 Tax=Pseudozyma antarctica (strain T-34) TaxID=1151754 RepID=M9MD81_PSEA3|nr:cell-cycle nuclear protein [Moesziomyces antarcticus T-34]